jgi:hypothetical protein
MCHNPGERSSNCFKSDNKLINKLLCPSSHKTNEEKVYSCLRSRLKFILKGNSQKELLFFGAQNNRV